MIKGKVILTIAFSFFVGAVFAGGPPSAKIKNFPAKYQQKQEIFFKKTPDKVAQRIITLVIQVDGSAVIEVTDFFIGNFGIEGFKANVTLEAEGEYLEVKKSSTPLKRFNEFQVVGDDLFLNGSEGKLAGSVIIYSPVLLKRINI